MEGLTLTIALVSLIIALVVLVKFMSLCKDVHYIAEELYRKNKNHDEDLTKEETSIPSKSFSAHGYIDIIVIVVIAVAIVIAVVAS